MGRDTETIAQWQGQSAQVRALLEATEIILRGGIRARVLRDLITSMSIEQGALRLATDRGHLVLELGEGEALRWLAAMQKPVPTLAQKRGVSPACLAFVRGEVEDAALAAALRGVATADLGRGVGGGIGGGFGFGGGFYARPVCAGVGDLVCLSEGARGGGDGRYGAGVFSRAGVCG